jgi:competence protein ComEC
MTTVAKSIIKPAQTGIFRTIFLYTGQGETTLLVIPDGNNYRYILLDCDEDKEKYEVDLVKMFGDLFDAGQKLDVYINSHPHRDHTQGIRNLYDKIGIREVWHSNHTSNGKHEGAYGELKYVVDKVGKANTFHLKGSNELNKLQKSDDETAVTKKLGDIDFQVLSPAKYVCDDIEDEEPEQRNKRIHEQCGVMRFSYKNKHIMTTGDSDKKAWQDHITNYHRDNLSSEVLSASHHCSYTFFKNSREDEDVYEDHIQQISPQYLVVSAPRKEDSPHGHPDEEAMDLYKKYVEQENIYHLGKEYECLIADIDASGTLTLKTDKELIKAYGQKPEKTEEEKKKELAAIASRGHKPYRP